MILILEIISPQPTGGGALRQTFDAGGGTIGRENDNSWVLPHSKVSGHHAVISCRDGVYCIEDRSRNGVCLNSSRNRLERGRPYPLKSGDRILIDPYEIRASVTSQENDTSQRPAYRPPSEVSTPGAFFDAEDPFALDTDDPFGPRPILSSGLEPPEDVAGPPLDPLELLNLLPKQAPARKAPNVRDLDLGSPLDAHYRPPAVVSAPAPEISPGPAIPAGYDPLAPDDAPSDLAPPSAAPPVDRRKSDWSRPDEEAATPAPAAPPQAHPIAPPAPPAVPARRPPDPPQSLPAPVQAFPIQPPPAPPAAAGPPVTSAESARAQAPAENKGSSAADFAAVLAGAGLNPSDIAPELARDFGRILRVVVSGVMDVMRSRQEIKDEFRMRTTRFRTAENNPLKFSANVDDALHNLLVKRNPAYLPAVEAFEDAFADLRHHQIAMLAGMRVAFEAMLADFDPDRLQEEFDRQLNKGIVPAKLRYWDLFRERRQAIVNDPEASFRRLFGEEFARAYEAQLKELKAQESSVRTSSSKAPGRPND